eukprot:TRINITY_DN10572_c0_g3_i2.p3 TRINITY_DN10572_c0_g3~~TRINITY_DN10572_c0_g3_i2.p3  ORF type:complete len:201 (+),score=68.70 TRINITY_DN10572_c0_g3_i2:1975-2577(+)
MKEAVKKFSENVDNNLAKLSPEIREPICDLACLASADCVNALQKMDAKAFAREDKNYHCMNMLMRKDLSEEELWKLAGEELKETGKTLAQVHCHDFYCNCLRTVEKYLKESEFEKLSKSNLMEIISFIPNLWIMEYRDYIGRLKDALPQEIPEAYVSVKEEILSLHKIASKTRKVDPSFIKAIDELYLSLIHISEPTRPY